MRTQRFARRFSLALAGVLGLGLSTLGQTNYYVSQSAGNDDSHDPREGSAPRCVIALLDGGHSGIVDLETSGGSLEVRIYNRALTAAEIEKLAKETK